MDINTTPPPTYSRRFYVAWFVLFTLISMALNGLHAWVVAPRAWNLLDPSIRQWLGVEGGGMPTWFATAAVCVSLIPPVALAAATHALVTPDPDTTSGRGTGARTTTWTIAGGAFTFSTVAMTDLTHTLLAVPIPLAVIMPIIVDVSIVAAVLRLEIRRTAHRAEAHIPEALEPVELVSPQVEPTSSLHEPPAEEQFVTQREAAREAPVAQSEEQYVFTDEPTLEQFEAQSAVTTGAAVKQPEARLESVREPRSEATTTRSATFKLTVDADELAARIAAETPISIPQRSVAAVLKRADQGESQRKIASALKGVSPTTAGRVIAAAKELQQERELVTTAA